MGADVAGGAQLARTARDAGAQLADLAAPGLEAARLVASAISDEAPVLTGHLARNVDAQVVAGHGQVVIGAPYAALVNARNPFVNRGIAATTDDVTDVFTDHVEDALDTIRGA